MPHTSYVNALFEKDDVSKAQFFKGLPRVLPLLPKRVVEQRVREML
jgi:SCY1-like protein 2